MKNGEWRVENEELRMKNCRSGGVPEWQFFIVHSSFSISTIIGKIPRLFLIFLRGNW